MQTKHLYFYVFTLVITAVVMGLAGYFYTLYKIKQLQEGGKDQESALEAKKIELANSVLNSTGISATLVNQGFWYTYTDAYGNTVVAFFDLKALARKGLSETEIQELVGALKVSEVKPGDTMKEVAETELPQDLQFHNELYTQTYDATYLTRKESLESKLRGRTYSERDIFQLAYIYELEGRYEERDQLNVRRCKEFNKGCEPLSVVTITGSVLNVQGDPVQNAIVEMLGSEGKSLTDEKGRYTVYANVSSGLEKLRVRAYKRNYSDGVTSVLSLSAGRTAYEAPPIVLSAPLTIVTIDTVKKTVTGTENKYSNNSFVLKTSESEYVIPEDSIVYESGKLYKGQVEVYLYEFTQETVPEGLTRVDTFDQVIGYAGDLMKTFGMPYIQFFTPNGEELHVLKSRPMVLTYRIHHMQELRENTANIYQPLTQQDMQLLVDATNPGSYNIDRDFLIENGLLRFPAFWVFDRIRGVWENVGVDVVDVNGTIRSEFYTRNDIP